MRKLFLLLLLACATHTFAQIKVNDRQKSATDFPLHANGKTCNIQIDAADYEVVNKVSHLFAEDLERVTGTKGIVSDSKSIKEKETVIIGTLGRNKFIDDLVKKNKLDVSSIRNGWEQYVIKVVDAPSKVWTELWLLPVATVAEQLTVHLPCRKQWEYPPYTGGPTYRSGNKRLSIWRQPNMFLKLPPSSIAAYSSTTKAGVSLPGLPKPLTRSWVTLVPRPMPRSAS